MTLHLTLGCDPGQSGAIAIVADGQPVGFIDMPTMARTNGSGEQVNGAELAARFRGLMIEHRGAHIFAVVEAVNSMPGQGGSSMFRFGQADGKLKGVIETLGIGYIEVRPCKWKPHFGLTGKAETAQEKAALKDRARTLALQRFPHLAEQLARKKDVGRADALLIALWAHETEQAALKPTGEAQEGMRVAA